MTEMKILTVEKMSEIFGVDTVTVRDWIKNKRIPAKKIGKRWFVSSDKLLEFLDKQDVCPNCMTDMVQKMENNGFIEPDGPSKLEPTGDIFCPKCGYTK